MPLNENLTNNELKLRLTETISLASVPGIGPLRFHRLVAAFGSAAATLRASIRELEAVPGFSRALATAVKEQSDGKEALRVASRVVQLGWTVLFPDHPGYPDLLRTLPDHPPLLFRLGDPKVDYHRMVAIVGTRRPTEGGKRFAAGLAAALTREGIAVVSGLAEGIDSAAHRGALQAGGATVAVLGNSLDTVYPPTNRKLSADLEAGGALYSEYFPDTGPDATHFPERNRLISGMSQAVVVVEAGARSGALITAEHALEQGRELFAVPGSPEARVSIGANSLIKKGARLITSVDDIFEELPRLKGEVAVKRKAQLPELTELEKQIMDLCSPQPLHIDHIARSLNLPTAEVMEFLLALELKGIVQEVPGKCFVVTEEFQ